MQFAPLKIRVSELRVERNRLRQFEKSLIDVSVRNTGKPEAVMDESLQRIEFNRTA